MHVAAVFASVVLAAAHTIDAPVRTPVPTRAQDLNIFRDATELHDRGDYEGAISRYELILENNPDDISARYELTFSYFDAKRYEDCIETARIGVQYDSPLRGRFYSSMGSCLDQSGHTEQAVALYRKAIDALPADFMLPFNLGVTLQRCRQSEEAANFFRRSIANNPNYPGSHFQLGLLYARRGRRLPAVLALSRFVVLEPDSNRTAIAFQAMKTLLDSYVRVDGNEARTVVMATTADPELGYRDFTMAVALAAARSRSAPDSWGEAFASLFSSVAADEKNAGGFWDRYYFRYYADLNGKGFTQTFVELLTMTGNFPGADSWLRLNWSRVHEFQQWSRAYAW